MKFIHDDGGNDVDDGDVGGDANHDVGYDIIDDVNNHVDDDVGNGVGGCHPWHDHLFLFSFFIVIFLFSLFFFQKGCGQAPFIF